MLARSLDVLTLFSLIIFVARHAVMRLSSTHRPCRCRLPDSWQSRHAIQQRSKPFQRVRSMAAQEQRTASTGPTDAVAEQEVKRVSAEELLCFAGSTAALQFSFGIVSDVQYADINDGHSFLGVPRYYRASLDGLRRAVAGWQKQKVQFGIQFGDLIDGFNPKEQSETALKAVLHEFAQLQKPVYHMIGNHCLYNLPRTRLNEALGIQGVISHYSFSPQKAWRFVVIDAYDMSVLGWPDQHPLHQQAKAILDEKNINENKNNPEGHEGPARRFVAFGGGVSSEQLAWLKAELADAKQHSQKVIVCGHLPLHPDTCIGTCLLWNYEEVLQAIWDSGNVVATITGHAHNDGYALDKHGVHHRVLNAVLETKPGDDCYGWVDVYEDRLELTGVGDLDSLTMPYTAATDHSHGAKAEQARADKTHAAESAMLDRQP